MDTGESMGLSSWKKLFSFMYQMKTELYAPKLILYLSLSPFVRPPTAFDRIFIRSKLTYPTTGADYKR